MARTGISYQNVEEAALHLENSGITPTIDKVREILGTGSKSTLARYLKKWREQKQQEVDISGISYDILLIVKKLQMQLETTANQRIIEIETQYQQSQEDFNNKNALLQQQLNNLVKENKQIKNEKKSLEQSYTTLTQQTIKQTQTLNKKEQTVQVLHTKVEQLQQHLNDKQQTLQQQEAYFQHYQEQMVQERQQEKQYFQMTEQQLKQQLDALTQQWQEEKIYTKELLVKLEQQTEENKTLSNEIIQLHNMIHKKEQEIDLLQHKKNITEHRIIEYENKQQQYQKNIDTLQTEKENQLHTFGQEKKSLSNSINRLVVQLQQKDAILQKYRTMQEKSHLLFKPDRDKKK